MQFPQGLLSDGAWEMIHVSGLSGSDGVGKGLQLLLSSGEAGYHWGGAPGFRLKANGQGACLKGIRMCTVMQCADGPHACSLQDRAEMCQQPVCMCTHRCRCCRLALCPVSSLHTWGVHVLPCPTRRDRGPRESAICAH